MIHSVHRSFSKNLKAKISGKPIFLNNYCGYISFFFFSCQKPNSYLLFNENELLTLFFSISVKYPLAVWWGLVLSDITVPWRGHILLQTYGGLQTFSKSGSAQRPTWNCKCGLRYNQNRLSGAMSWQASHGGGWWEAWRCQVVIFFLKCVEWKSPESMQLSLSLPIFISISPESLDWPGNHPAGTLRLYLLVGRKIPKKILKQVPIVERVEKSVQKWVGLPPDILIDEIQLSRPFDFFLEYFVEELKIYWKFSYWLDGWKRWGVKQDFPNMAESTPKPGRTILGQ